MGPSVAKYVETAFSTPSVSGDTGNSRLSRLSVHKASQVARLQLLAPRRSQCSAKIQSNL